MKTQFLLSLLLLSVVTCVAQQTLAEYDWEKLAKADPHLTGNVEVLDGRTVLKIVNTNSTPLLAQVLKIIKPPISQTFYAIRGEIKYEDVRGSGYLEMWNYFPPIKAGMPEGQYFTKTLGESGEMGKISGTSTWRRIALPFDRTGATGPPTRLEVNLVLPSQGTVYLTGLTLVEWTGNPFQGKGLVGGQWWPDQAGGWIGGVLGSLLGVLGGLLAWLSARGKSPRFVVITYKLLIGCGVISLLAGGTALLTHQPYGVWFPLLLIGVLLLLIVPFRLRQTKKLYADLELRRMAAIDAT